MPNFVVSYQRPSEVSTALTVLHGMDLITPPFSSKCMNVRCECCEQGKVLTRSIPPPEDVHILEEPVRAGQPSNGEKDVPVCNVRTQFPEYIPSEENGIVVVSPSCVQDAQVSRCEQGGRTKCDECDERYFFATNDRLSASQAEALFRDLISRKRSVGISSSQEPSGVDLHSPTDTIVPRGQWYAVCGPFHSRLADLRGHLCGPQTLPYLCTVNLVDPKTPPFTCLAYPMRHPEQKKALEDNIAKYLDMGIIEYGPSLWKTSLFVVPQKVNEEQRQLPTYQSSQQCRVVQDFIPLNTKIQKIENTLPLIADVFQIASEKEIFLSSRFE